MQSITLNNLSLKLNQQPFKKPFLYCLIRTAQQTYCTKSIQTNIKYADMLSSTLDLSFNKQNPVLCIQVWNYDTQSKIEQVCIDAIDLPYVQNQKQLKMNGMNVKLSYAKNNTMCSPRQSNTGTTTRRNSYNKSQLDTKINFRSNLLSPQNYHRFSNKQTQQQLSKQTNLCRNSTNSTEKWNFVSIRNANMNRLKL